MKVRNKELNGFSPERPPEEWVQCEDNLSFMRRLPASCCDLIYVDPPFGTGRARSSKSTNHSYPDFEESEGEVEPYLGFMRPRLLECHRLLKETGTLYVHLDWRFSHYIRVQLDEIFGASCFLNEIIWSYRTGGVARRWFPRKHDTILVYAKAPGKHIFNPQRSGEYRTDGLKRDSHGRPYKTTVKGRLYFHADGPVVSDVWDIPFLSTVSRERIAWPTQKPLALVDRIIRASSNPGDLVADFFCGSGTTLVAAKRLGRRYLGCDILPDAIRIAQNRLAPIAAAIHDDTIRAEAAD